MSRTREHRDRDLAFGDGAARIHVPPVTHPGVVFTLDGRRPAMEAGSAWYLRPPTPEAGQR